MTKTLNPSDVFDALNRLLHALCRSLPMYLDEARPWACRDDEPAEKALAEMTVDGRALAARVAEAIIEHGDRPEPGRFPTEFTAMNDVSVDYILPEVIRRQRGHVAEIELCVAGLEGIAALHALAEDVLEHTKTHLRALEETAHRK